MGTLGRLLAQLALGALLTTPAFAAPGEADTAFAGTGEIAFDFGPTESIRAVRALDDGVVLVAAHSRNPENNYEYLHLARFLADGSPDESFGDAGRIDVPLVAAYVGVLGLQSDGRILSAGSTGKGFVVQRRLADGTLDASFAGDGSTFNNFVGGFHAEPLAIGAQADGKVVVAGFVVPYYSPYSQIALMRFNADGSNDASFGGGDGRVAANPFGTPGFDYAHALALLPDGKILTAGRSHDTLSVARFAGDGTLDPDFGCGGGALAAAGDGDLARADHVAIGPNGAITAAGVSCPGDYASACSVAVARFLADGRRDATFGDAGVALVDKEAYVNGLAVQDDGAVVLALAEYHYDYENYVYTPGAGSVLRLVNDATPDEAFNAAAPLYAESAMNQALVHTTDGLLVAGQRRGELSGDSYLSDSFLARLQRGTDGPAPAPGTAVDPAPGYTYCSNVILPPVGSVDDHSSDGGSGGAPGPVLLAVFALAAVRRRPRRH